MLWQPNKRNFHRGLCNRDTGGWIHSSCVVRPKIIRLMMWRGQRSLFFFSHITAMVESMFDDMLRLIGFVDRKPEVVALICLNTYQTEFSAVHFRLCFISLRQILKILCAREISSFYVTYLTFDLDL